MKSVVINGRILIEKTAFFCYICSGKRLMKSVEFEEDMMIRGLFGKLFKSNVINEQETPSRKLCDDIQNDYWGSNRDNRNGFLEKELFIDGQKYNVVSSEQSDSSFKVMVEDEYNTKVFSMQILYGIKRDSNDQHIIYIERFCRLNEHSCGIGKEMAIYIRNLAESRGFQIIGVHPVAETVANKGYMNQEELEKFYKKYLNGENVRLEFLDNSDCISSVGWRET